MKTLLKLVVGLLILVVAAVVVLVIFIDRAAKNAIEYGATSALGVSTTVDNVSVGLVSGQFGLKGLDVANPSGFDAGDHFLKLNTGRLDLPLTNLTREKIVVPKIELTGLDLVLEKKGDRSNYQTILNNLKKTESDEKPADQKEGKQYAVERIVLNDIHVHAYVVKIGSAKPRPVEVQIKQVSLQYDSKEGMNIDELTSLILKTVMVAVMQNAGDLLPGVIMDGLGEGLKGLDQISGQLTSEAGKLVGDVSKKLEEVTGGKALEGVTKELDSTTKDVGKTIEGLLGGKKDK